MKNANATRLIKYIVTFVVLKIINYYIEQEVREHNTALQIMYTSYVVDLRNERTTRQLCRFMALLLYFIKTNTNTCYERYGNTALLTNF